MLLNLHFRTMSGGTWLSLFRAEGVQATIPELQARYVPLFYVECNNKLSMTMWHLCPVLG